MKLYFVGQLQTTLSSFCDTLCDLLKLQPCVRLGAFRSNTFIFFNAQLFDYKVLKTCNHVSSFRASSL